tara:strand:- start:1465 stop:1575 length:111 start_codon:yes stop_codon:yes gene_type:complete
MSRVGFVALDLLCRDHLFEDYSKLLGRVREEVVVNI